MLNWKNKTVDRLEIIMYTMAPEKKKCIPYLANGVRKIFTATIARLYHFIISSLAVKMASLNSLVS
jgi:hypothetical protein